MLKQTITDLRPEQGEPMPAPSDAEVTRYAAILQRGGGRQVGRRGLWNWRLLAGAAALIMAALGVWLALRPTPVAADRLLAQAYAERRSIDMRFPGAAYSRLSVERSARSAEVSRPLLNAELEIANALAGGKADADWLQAQGRAALLRWDFDRALDSLGRAQSLRPGDASTMADLGMAYFERGEAEGRGADYSSAAEWLSRAMQADAQSPVYRFNRAVAFERLHLYSQAASDWKEMLAREPSGGWADEARVRLADVEEKLKSGAELLTPGAYLQGRAGFADPELALRAALESWLDAAGRGDREAAEALEALASDLLRKHQDSWLGDLAAARAHSLGQQAIGELVRAVTANARGRSAEAERASLNAERLFRTAGNAAGLLFSEYQTAYAEQRSLRRGECAEKSERLSVGVPTQYPWVRAQTWVERGVCRFGLGDFDAAWKDFAGAALIASQAGYRETAFRARAFQNSYLAELGDDERAWSSSLNGLSEVWGRPHDRLSPFHFYSGMVTLSSHAGDWHTALAIKRESMDAVAFVQNTPLDAINHYRAAGLALNAGANGQASGEFQIAEALFRSLPPEKQYQAYTFYCELGRAEAELRTGDVSAAISRLDQLTDRSASTDDSNIRLRYFELLGRARMRRGDQVGAATALEQAHRMAVKNRTSLRDPRQQTVWSNDNRELYHALVQSRLAAGADSDALQIWREYLGGPIPPSAVPVISYAVMTDRTVSWLQIQGRVWKGIAPVSRDQLEALITRFRKDCGDPRVPIDEIRSEGRKLYSWLLAPTEGHVAGRIWVEPDGVMGGLPWEALVTGTDKWAGEVASYSIALNGVHNSADLTLSAQTRLLMVAAAGPRTDGGRRLEPLPGAEREASGVAALFRKPVVLSGRDATVQRVQRELPEAEVFHFAGHHGDSGLLLPEGEGPGVLDSRDFAAGKGRCQMAVLSACRTAASAMSDVWNPDTLIAALHRAGVAVVVAARWSVDSEQTADFMERFYLAALRGETPDGALQSAAAWFRKGTDGSHPYYWAAFGAFRQ